MTVKHWLHSALAVVLAAACLLLGACSTPAVALEVGGETYAMGDYLAYVYNTISSDTNLQMYMYYYGSESLDMKLPYGEGDDAEQITIDEYIRLTARDTIYRQEAAEDLMAKYEIKWDDELLKEANEALKTVENDACVQLGFTKARYEAMYKAVMLNESSLFTGLYDKGGLREVSDADERKFFDENYLSYFLFEVSLVNEDNSAKSDADIAKIQAQFDKYVKDFNAGKKTIEDFQELNRQYEKDAAAAEVTDKEDDKDTKTTTTTAATTTTTTTTTTGSGGAQIVEGEEVTTLTRQDIVKVADGVDEELVKAVTAVPEGEAAVKTYKKNGTTNTMAVIFRLDPEAQRGKKDGKDVDFYADSHDQTLQHMKYKEFDAEVQKQMDELAKDAVVNQKALKAADLKEMMAYLGVE